MLEIILIGLFQYIVDVCVNLGLKYRPKMKRYEYVFEKMI